MSVPVSHLLCGPCGLCVSKAVISVGTGVEEMLYYAGC